MPDSIIVAIEKPSTAVPMYEWIVCLGDTPLAVGRAPCMTDVADSIAEALIKLKQQWNQ